MQSWGTEEYYGNPFLYWKVVGEYRYPVVLNSLLAKFAAVFPEVSSLLYYFVKHTLILDDINQDNNKVLEYDITKTVKFHRLERIMEKAVSTF